MGIRFACHACRKSLNVKTELVGKRGVCPQCGIRFRIPSGSGTVSSPVEDTPADITPEPTASAVPRNPLAAASGRPAGAAAAVSLLDDPTAEWYVRPPSGGQYGPATGAVLRDWIAEARVTATSLIWRDGWPQWRSAAETLVEFGAEVSSAPVVTKTYVAPRAAAPVPIIPQTGSVASISRRRRSVSSGQLLLIGGLATLSLALIVLLIYLIQRS